MNDIVKSNDPQKSIAASRNYQEALQLWNGNSAYRNIAVLIGAHLSDIDSFAAIAGSFVGGKVVEKVYDHQYFNPIYGSFKNFLSRNIYLSKEKRRKMENQRYTAGYAASFVTEAGIKLLSRGVADWANKRNTFTTLNEMHRFLYAYVSQNTLNAENDMGLTELSKIRASFPITTKEKQKVKEIAMSQSTALSDIIDNCSFMSDDSDDLRISISYFLFAIHCQMFGESYDESEPLKYIMKFYNVLGFHDAYAKELLRENTESYKTVTNDQLKYLKLARNFIQNVFIDIPEIDKGRLSEQAKLMAAYDPYSIRRKKTQTVAKAGGQTIMGIYQKNPKIIIQAAGTALSQLDFEGNDNAADYIWNLFTQKGIEEKDIESMIECSTCISDNSTENEDK